LENSEIAKVFSPLLNPFGSLERILRYVTPGALFGLFYILSHQSSLYVAYPWFFYASLPFIGIAFYSLHRTFFEIIDWLIWCKISLRSRALCNQSFHPIQKMAEYIKITLSRTSRFEELRGWTYVKWGTIHLSLLVAELMILFSFFSTDPSFIRGRFGLFNWGGFIVFGFSFIAYVINTLISYELFLGPNRITEEDLSKLSCSQSHSSGNLKSGS